jgi:hypothetical protein
VVSRCPHVLRRLVGSCAQLKDCSTRPGSVGLCAYICVLQLGKSSKAAMNSKVLSNQGQAIALHVHTCLTNSTHTRTCVLGLCMCSLASPWRLS